MNEIEAKVRCLELAATLSRGVTTDAASVVTTASVLYDFINAPPQVEKPAEITDKPKRGRTPKMDDLMS